MNVYIKTMGCKVNHFDTAVLMSQFEGVGMSVVNQETEADIAVVNSCSVTANADKEAFYLARRLKAKNPNALLVFTGCFAQTDSAALLDLATVDLVIPNELKHETASRVLALSLLSKEERSVAERFPHSARVVEKNKQSHFKTSHVLFGQSNDRSRTRSFIKVQDGCNGFCTYCLIPYARGASRSVPLRDIIDEVSRLEENGVREIVLTGIHVGDYGRDISDENFLSKSRIAREHPFAALVESLFENTVTMRYRISSLEPSELSGELLSVLSENRNRFCDHMHLPLQSGNNRILKAMSRSYTKEVYAQSVADIRAVFPDANIGADIMPGFPGETEDEHQESIQFLTDLKISYLHVFPYSKRPNTAALRMPNHLAPDIVARRSKELRELSSNLKLEYSKSQIGKVVDVLWQRESHSDGRTIGLSGNYLRVLPRQGRVVGIGEVDSVKLLGVAGEDDLMLCDL